MSRKHLIVALLAGWAIAFVFPPQRALGYFRKGQ